MPRIFDNIEQELLPALQNTLDVSERADFCVGYFNLRGWKHLADHIEHIAGGDSQCCRLLVGMQQNASEELRKALSFFRRNGRLDNGTVLRLKRELAKEFRKQLTVGSPTDADEKALLKFASQIREQKVKVKLYLRHPACALPRAYQLRQEADYDDGAAIEPEAAQELLDEVAGFVAAVQALLSASS